MVSDAPFHALLFLGFGLGLHVGFFYGFITV